MILQRQIVAAPSLPKILELVDMAHSLQVLQVELLLLSVAVAPVEKKVLTKLAVLLESVF